MTAAQDTASLGQGKIKRIGTTDSTKVIALDADNPSMLDTVLVRLLQFSYDSLRIVAGDSTVIDHLDMRSDMDTLLKVEGKQSDDGRWVPVDGNWLYSSDNGSLSSSQPAILWNFAPGDTGRGTIVVSIGNTSSDAITVKINPGLPATLVLYPKPGVPDSTNIPYDPSTVSIPDSAGNPFPLVAKIFDKKGVWLNDFETSDSLSELITWNVIELNGDTTGTLDLTTGFDRTFTAKKAYDTVKIAAHYGLFSDTVQLKILPGRPARLILEGSAVNPPLNAAAPKDTLRILSNIVSASLYAVLRDKYDNFCGFANVKTWGALDTSAVDVQPGNVKLGEGVVERKKREDTTVVFANNGTLGDSCVVLLVGLLLYPFAHTCRK